MRSFDKFYDSVNKLNQLKERLNFNYSWFDMLYYMTEKVEKKEQQEIVRKVI